MAAFILHSNTLFVMQNQYASYLRYEFLACLQLNELSRGSQKAMSKAMFQQDQFKFLLTIWIHLESISGKNKKILRTVK